MKAKTKKPKTGRVVRAYRCNIAVTDFKRWGIRFAGRRRATDFMLSIAVRI